MKNKIIVDIDGTIANLDHRLPYILNEDGSQKDSKEKDWDNFYKDLDKDKPIERVLEMIRNIVEHNGYNILVITGRSAKYLKQTHKWVNDILGKHIQGQFTVQTEMRSIGDRRDDDIVKKERLHSVLSKEELKRVTHVFEDRPRCLKMYREELPEAIIVDCGNFNHFKDER